MCALVTVVQTSALPSYRHACALSNRDQQCIGRIADALAGDAFDMRDAGGHFRAHAVGEGLALVVIARAHLGGDGEAGRHRQADTRHLREIRALAAEQVPVACAAIRNAAAEAVTILSPYLPSTRLVRRTIVWLVN